MPKVFWNFSNILFFWAVSFTIYGIMRADNVNPPKKFQNHNSILFVKMKSGLKIDFLTHTVWKLKTFPKWER